MRTILRTRVAAWIVGWVGIVLFVPVCAVHAATFYVDQHAPAAQQADGSAAQPFRTIQEAVDRAQAGDTVLVRAGTYRETVYFEHGGAPGQPLTLAAYPGEQVVISGADVLNGWQPKSKDERWLWTKKIPSAPGGVFVDGKPLRLVGGDPVYSKISSLAKYHTLLQPMGKGLKDMVPGTFYYDSADKTLYLWMASSKRCWPEQDAADKPTIEAAMRGPVIWGKPNISDICLRNLTVRYGTSLHQQWSLVQLRGNRMTVDLTGSAPQLDHAPINMPFHGTTDMAVLLTLRTLLLPETAYPNLPHNAGIFRPIRIDAPKGTIVNPVFPAPTIGRFCGGQMVGNLVVRALQDVLPEQVCAGCSTTKAITFAGQQAGESWIYMDVTEGAYGGMDGMDGLDAVDVLYANTKNNPIEDIEAHYPLRVERYELREDAPGDGRWRGGFGPVRDTRILVDGFIGVEGDGFRHPDRKSTRLNSSHTDISRMPSSA